MWRQNATEFQQIAPNAPFALPQMFALPGSPILDHRSVRLPESEFRMLDQQGQYQQIIKHEGQNEGTITEAITPGAKKTFVMHR
jgi:hypothetical protein